MTLEQLAYVFKLVSNDVQYVHFLAKGKYFDTLHEYSEELYKKLTEDTDTIVEMALEDSKNIINFNARLDINYKYLVADNGFSLEEGFSCIQSKLEYLLKSIESVHELKLSSASESKIDDIAFYYQKELKYKLKRRSYLD